MPVSNCAKCKRVFSRTHSPLCPACQQAAFSQVSHVYRFVQGNPQMTLEEIAENCTVSVKELEKMLSEGKLGTAASKIIYHCQRCSVTLSVVMRRGRFCPECAEKIEAEAGLHHPHGIPAERSGKARSDHPPGNPAEADSGDSSLGAPPLLGAAVRNTDPERGAKGSSVASTTHNEEPASHEETYGFKRIND